MSLRRLLGLTMLVSGLVAAPSAQASFMASRSTDCVSLGASSPVFKTALGDPFDYSLSPGGNFESGGQEWTLTGGAAVVGAGSTFKAGGTVNAGSLQMPPGAIAISPRFCAGWDEPTMRMFARTVAGSSGTLTLLVFYTDEDGNLRNATVGFMSPGLYKSWRASPITPFAMAVPMGNYRTAVQLAIIAGKGTTWQIDDVYIDPYRHR
jgi:hypothetical protein